MVRDLADVLQRQDAELAETKARLADRDSEIEKLRLFLSALKRQRFGRSSEKCHPDQLYRLRPDRTVVRFGRASPSL